MSIVLNLRNMTHIVTTYFVQLVAGGGWFMDSPKACVCHQMKNPWTGGSLYFHL